MRKSLLVAALAGGLALAGGCDRGGHRSGPAARPTSDQDRDAPAVGALAPGGTLSSAAGDKVALAERWPASNETVVVFYRGFF